MKWEFQIQLFLEEGDNCRVAFPLRDLQRRLAVLLRPVDLRAVVQQQPCRVDAALPAGDVQRCRTLLIRPVDLGSFI